MMSRLCTSTSSPKDVSCGAVLLENSLLVLTLLDRAYDTVRSVTSSCYSACPHTDPHGLRQPGTRRMNGAQGEARSSLGLSKGTHSLHQQRRATCTAEQQH